MDEKKTPFNSLTPINMVEFTEMRTQLATCKPILQVGEYQIRRWDKDSFWIQKNDGEGMQISEDKLIKYLDNLWASES